MSKSLRSTLLAVLVGLLIFVAGIWLGGHSSHLPGFVSNALVEQTPGKVYDQALGLIESDYYRKVDANKLTNTAIGSSIASLRDPFSNYYSPQDYKAMQLANRGGYQGIGVVISSTPKGLRVITVFNNSPAKTAGIKSGDVITVVNGHSLAGKSTSQADALIHGKVGTTVELKIVGTNGKTRTLKIRRAEVTAPLVISHMKEVNGVKVGYVALSQFGPGAGTQTRAAVEKLVSQGAKGIVLDLRYNPGGFIQEAIGVASIFIPGGKKIVTTKGRTVGTHVYTATGDQIKSSIPVAVLVNNYSASSAEIVTSALQDYHRAIVVGQHSFGKGVFQDVVGLSNGGAVELVAGEYFTPNGRNLGGGGIKRGAGVTPNISIKNPTSGTDEQLKVALQTVVKKVKQG
jgi:carboxyl-terminal processing protease